MTLYVSEVFGPTVQGEGPYMGRRAMFVRLGGCNLSCSWCDTPYTWNGARFDLRHEIAPQSSESVLVQLDEWADGIVVITGGKPLLQASYPEFSILLRALRNRGREVHVESNGTIFPPHEVLEMLDVVVLSPKLANAGKHRGGQSAAMHAGWATVVAEREVYLKIVCRNGADVASVAELAEDIGWPRDRVWVMPEGTRPETIAASITEIADAAIAFGVNVSSRLQVLAWGDVRGH